MKENPRIVTDGYRGPLSGFAYLPAGEYTVGEKLDIGRRVVSPDLADHMVRIGKARVTFFGVPDDPPVEQPPADQKPGDDQPPADEPPADEQPPADQPPADEPPADEPPADDQPKKKSHPKS